MENLPPEQAGRIREQKERIRKTILAARLSAPAAELAAASRQIFRRLQAEPCWQAGSFVCTYLSSKPGEVDTLELIRSALAQGKRVCVPVIEPLSRDLRLVEIFTLDNLVRGHFGILEPPVDQGIVLAGADWDLAIVPGVAFDRRGHRIGFGKGYYDRLLSPSAAPRVALAFSFQVVEPFETLPHDLNMDLLITEKETIRPR